MPGDHGPDGESGIDGIDGTSGTDGSKGLKGFRGDAGRAILLGEWGEQGMIKILFHIVDDNENKSQFWFLKVILVLMEKLVTKVSQVRLETEDIQAQKVHYFNQTKKMNYIQFFSTNKLIRNKRWKGRYWSTRYTWFIWQQRSNRWYYLRRYGSSWWAWKGWCSSTIRRQGLVD